MFISKINIKAIQNIGDSQRLRERLTMETAWSYCKSLQLHLYCNCYFGCNLSGQKLACSAMLHIFGVNPSQTLKFNSYGINVKIYKNMN